MTLFDGSVGWGTLALLFVCLAIALSFEFVNGFHDTANAVATVIYTKSLKPWVAVIWSGSMNFLGVLLGGAAVAFSIVHLLPVDLLINIGRKAGLLMVLSLLVAAILWNFGTWYFGLPASSSHALIGSILGVGLASSLFSGHGFGSGVNWTKAQQVGLSLLISPLVGFLLAGGLLLLSKDVFDRHFVGAFLWLCRFVGHFAPFFVAFFAAGFFFAFFTSGFFSRRCADFSPSISSNHSTRVLATRRNVSLRDGDRVAIPTCAAFFESSSPSEARAKNIFSMPPSMPVQLFTSPPSSWLSSAFPYLSG